jgi:hypothetical protein
MRLGYEKSLTLVAKPDIIALGDISSPIALKSPILPYTMNKTDLSKLLDEARAEWEQALSGVGHERMTEPGVAGNWTVKDVVAHVTWSVKETVGMMQAKALAGSDLWRLPEDERNAAVYTANRDRPLDEVLAESEAAHARLTEIVQTTGEDDLLQAEWFTDLPGDWPPWRVIQVNVIDHYHHHARDVGEWLEGMAKDRED